MTIDQAIYHMEDIARQYNELGKSPHVNRNCQDDSLIYRKTAEEYQQIADWLKDYDRIKMGGIRNGKL